MLRYVWADRPLFLTLLAIGVVGFGSDRSIALAPSLAAELGGGTRSRGFGFLLGMTGLGTLVQGRAPDDPRGRIMALWLVGFVGSRPVAAAVLGATADMVTVRSAFVVAAALVLGAALLCRPRVLARPQLVPMPE